MKKLVKISLVVLIILFTFICNDTNWIEHGFNLNYCMGDAVDSWLLAIIASILVVKYK